MKAAWEILRSKSDDATVASALAMLSDDIRNSNGSAKSIFELAGAYDFLDEEETALKYYEQVHKLGVESLPIDDQPRLYVQMGSTLRNCFQFDASRELLIEGVTKFPEDKNILAFLALTNYTLGDERGSSKNFVRQVVEDGATEYLRALKFYLENIDVFPVRICQGKDSDQLQIKNVVFSVLTEYGLKPDPGDTDSDLDNIETHYLRSGGAFDVIESFDGSILGTGGLFPLADGACELRKMYLSKQARGKGLGKKLLRRLLHRAKELGFRRVELETASVLKEAIVLYKSFGFKELHKDHLPCRCDQAFVLELD